MKWTLQQLKAIYYRPQAEMLISAAAGSGKTAVLTERIIQLALIHNISPEQLIVLTFTDKAAGNMKQRLEKSVKERCQATNDPQEKAALQTLQNQLALAQISTIHAFCLRIIQEYKHLLVDENQALLYPRELRTLDPSEADMLLEEALDEVLAEDYQAIADYRQALAQGGSRDLEREQSFAAFERMQGIGGSQKTDEMFRQTLLADYKFLRSLPDYMDWLQASYKELETASLELFSSPDIRHYLGQLEGYVKKAEASFVNVEASPFYADMLELARKGKKTTKEQAAFLDYYPQLQDFVQKYWEIAATSLPQTAKDRTLWDLAVEYGIKLSPWSPLSARGSGDKLELREIQIRDLGPLLQQLGGNFGESSGGRAYALDSITAPFIAPASRLEAAARDMLPVAASYSQILARLDSRYQELKQARSQIDFADYEHLAYELLRQPEISEILQAQFVEILIDEYQDTSPLQEALLQAMQIPRISMLGDIKQSIYRFRHADPGIFNTKLREFKDSTPSGPDPQDAAATASFIQQSVAASPSTEGSGERILLNKNFRSRPQVLELINRFFQSFLRQKSGEIDYDASQALQAGKQEEDFPARSARTPALKISFTYASKGEPRPKFLEDSGLTAAQVNLYKAYRELLSQGFAPGEIAVLTRTNDLGLEAEEALSYFGVESNLKEEWVFLSSPEERLLHNLVALLANFAQDIPLLSVLRSDLLGEAFPEDELYTIASYPLSEEDPEQPHYFYEHFLSFCQSTEDGELFRKARKFLELYQNYRQEASYLSLEKVLRRIVEGSLWLDKLSQQNFAGERLADWERFLELARSYARRHPQDVAGFHRYLEQVAEQKLTLEEQDAAQEYTDRPQIMTIHKAKGLEFAAVIYYEAARSSQTKTRRSLFSFDADLGLAVNYPISDYAEIYAPRAQRFDENALFKERAEAYRLLYVCLTRASEMLYITAADTDSAWKSKCQKIQHALEASSSHVLSDTALNFLKSDFDLLLAWLALEGLKLEESGSFQQETEELTLEVASLTEVLAELASLPVLELPASATQEESHPEADASPQLARVESSFTDFPRFPETPSELEQVAKLLSSELPGDELLGIPAKITVSEAQEQASLSGTNSDLAMLSPGLREMALELRPSSPQTANFGLSPSAYGRFLHRIFQQLRPRDYFQGFGGARQVRSDAWQVYQDFIDEALRLAALAPEHKQLALEAWPYVETFLNSSLAQRLIQAEEQGAFVGRELPFTLAQTLDIPGQENPELRLVQGMIDLFFDEGDATILVDYKSDRLTRHREEIPEILGKRYSLQVEYYSQALQKLRNKQVKERYIWLIREGRAYRL